MKKQAVFTNKEINMLKKINKVAETEGWAIFESHGDTIDYRIERIDDMEIFGNDKEAVQFVFAKSEEKSIIHSKALEFIDKYSSESEKEYMKKWTNEVAAKNSIVQNKQQTNKLKVMKEQAKFLTLILFILFATLANAQEKPQAIKNNGTVVKDTTINKVSYKLYKGTKGGKYIVRVSKSGKEYKQYF